MHRHDAPRRFLLALVAAGILLGCFVPVSASADAPAAISGAATAALAIRATSGLGSLRATDVLELEPEAANRGFIADDLLEKATDVVNNGVRLRNAPAGGSLYVHFKPQGFGGVLSLRYRR